MSYPTRTASNAMDPSPAVPDNMVHAQVCWNPMPAEAHCAVQFTLEEQAWFARLATAALDMHSAADMSGGNTHYA